MKLSIMEWCVLIMTGLFLAFTIGYFTGNSHNTVISTSGSTVQITFSEDSGGASSENIAETSDIAEQNSADTDVQAEISAELITDTVMTAEGAGETASETADSAAADPEISSEVQYNSSLININTASAEELEELPGIGETLALRIIAYREEHGPFQTIADISNVSGIGDGKLAAIQDYITVGD